VRSCIRSTSAPAVCSLTSPPTARVRRRLDRVSRDEPPGATTPAARAGVPARG
jgi:hypothetical protein